MLMNAPKHGVETRAKNLYRHKLSLLQYAVNESSGMGWGGVILVYGWQSDMGCRF